MDAPHDADGPCPVPSPGRALLEVGPLSGRRGVRATGEINVLTRPSWEAALSVMARCHEDVSYVEMSELQFVDVAGVAALAVTSLNLSGGRLVLEEPPSELRRILDIFWPDLPTIEVVPR